MKTLIQLVSIIALAFQVAGAVVPASSPAQGSVSGGGNSFNPIFSADGQHLVFVSHANNLVANDDLGMWLDVFARDLVSSNTVLVSVSTSGVGGANADANYPSVSSNGQFIAFASRASNLVAGDTNGAIDVFVRDVNAGITRLVSVDVNGNAPIDPAPSSNIPLSGSPQISADGRWVFFESRATNLIAAGAPLGSVNIYARDTWSNVTVLVSMDTNGVALGSVTTLGSITADARYAAFTTTNQSVIQNQPNAGPDVYVRDLQAGVTLWASTNASVIFSGASYACSYPVLAKTGAGLAFMAVTNGSALPMFFDLQTATRTTIYFSAISNVPPVVNADASFVAFENGQSGVTQILLWNRASGIVSNVHQKLLGNYPNNRTIVDALSDDGRFVVYREFGSDSPYFTNTFIPRYNIFRKDLQTTEIKLVSAATDGGASVSSFEFSGVTVSSDASGVAFDSTANDLAAGDLNGASDIFLRDVNAGATELITKAHPSKPASTSFAHTFLGPNSVSADGRFVVSTRYDDPSAPRDTNGWTDIFVSDALSGANVAVSINTNLYTTNFDGGVFDPPGMFIENTNAYSSPVISADGSTIYAVRRSPSGQTRIFGAFISNALAGAGMGLASRGVNVSENGNSFAPSVSSNGLLLVFTSTSSDLVGGVSDYNSTADVFLRRTVLSNGIAVASNQLISLSLYGGAGNAASSNGFISPDSRWVIFESVATDLVPYIDQTGGRLRLYARDLLSNVTYLVSLDSLVQLTPGSATISGTSRYVAYADSWSSDVLVHDLNFHTNRSLLQELGGSYILSAPSLNYDGHLIAFQRTTDANRGNVQLYVRDSTAGRTDLVSANPAGAPANVNSVLRQMPQISSDGRYVVFQSTASDLVPGDNNNANDIFVRDRLLGVTTLISANSFGLPGNGPSTRPVMAADGRTVVFQSFANDLVSGDYNDKRDVFVLKLGGVDSDGDGMDDDWEVAYFGNLSRDGTGDFDGYGVSDLQEFLAGTDPTNSNSVFRVFTVAPIGGGSAHVMWTGNPARNYRVEFKDDLNAASWTPLNGIFSWNGSTASMTDTTATNSTHRYYHVVRLP